MSDDDGTVAVVWGIVAGLVLLALVAKGCLWNDHQAYIEQCKTIMASGSEAAKQAAVQPAGVCSR